MVGLRVSEVIGLRWSDCDFESGEIHLSRGIVRQHETGMKTEASRKPVPMEQGLAEVLTVCIQPARRLRLCFNQDARQATDLAEQRNGGSHPSCSEASRDYETDRLAYAQAHVRYAAQSER